MTPRARPLPPAERRASIIAAARPLFASHGITVSTRDIADAAGIAEGTLFRVFPTKHDLLAAVIEDLLDPTPLCARIDALESDDATAAVANLLQVLADSITETSAFFTALHTRLPEPGAPATKPHPHPKHRPFDDPLHQHRANLLRAAIVRHLSPFAGDLRTDLDHAASLIRGTAFAVAHPMFSDHLFTDMTALADLVAGGLVSQES